MVASQFIKVQHLGETINQLFPFFMCQEYIITSSTYSLHIALQTTLTTKERVFLATRLEYCLNNCHQNTGGWRRVAANLRFGFNGFMFQVCCVQTRLRALLTISSYNSFGLQRILEGSMIFFSELNLIDATLARFPVCSIGHLNMRCTQLPLPNLNRSLMSWLIISYCWKTYWCAICAYICNMYVHCMYLDLTFSVITYNLMVHVLSIV